MIVPLWEKYKINSSKGSGINEKVATFSHAIKGIGYFGSPSCSFVDICKFCVVFAFTAVIIAFILRQSLNSTSSLKRNNWIIVREIKG